MTLFPNLYTNIDDKILKGQNMNNKPEKNNGKYTNYVVVRISNYEHVYMCTTRWQGEELCSF